MRDSDPILSGGQGERAFRLYEPVRRDGRFECRVVILERGALLWEQAIFGEDRNNAIHCALISLNGFFDDLRLPPVAVARAMDGPVG